MLERLLLYEYSVWMLLQSIEVNTAVYLILKNVLIGLIFFLNINRNCMVFGLLVFMHFISEQTVSKWHKFN